MKILNTRRALMVAAIALLTSACSSATYPAADRAAARRSITQLEVTNHNWMDVTVYAHSYSQRVRIGTVTSGSTGRFTLPRNFTLSSGDVRLEADPVGSSEVFMSEPIMVTPGTTIVWKVENHIALSSYHVRSL